MEVAGSVPHLPSPGETKRGAFSGVNFCTDSKSHEGDFSPKTIFAQTLKSQTVLWMRFNLKTKVQCVNADLTSSTHVTMSIHCSEVGLRPEQVGEVDDTNITHAQFQKANYGCLILWRINSTKRNSSIHVCECPQSVQLRKKVYFFLLFSYFFAP